VSSTAARPWHRIFPRTSRTSRPRIPAECRVTAAGGLANVMTPANPYYNPLATYAQNPALFATHSLLAQGCVPINPFGTQVVSPAALNYSFGFLDERLRYEQTVVGYNTSGNMFDGIGAGPFSMAAGVEWRQEVGHNDEVSCLANDAACQARIQDFATRGVASAYGSARCLRAMVLVFSSTLGASSDGPGENCERALRRGPSILSGPARQPAAGGPLGIDGA
jgi:hypothetical protein